MIGVISHRTANRADILAILSNPSEVTTAELRANGFDPSAAIGYIQGALERGEAWTFLEDDVPVCILGLAKVGEDRFNTWFICTQRFFDLGTATLFPARRTMNEIRRRYPAADIHSYTWSPKSSVQRWFEILGFRYIEAEDGYKAFKLA